MQWLEAICIFLLLIYRRNEATWGGPLFQDIGIMFAIVDLSFKNIIIILAELDSTKHKIGLAIRLLGESIFMQKFILNALYPFLYSLSLSLKHTRACTATIFCAWNGTFRRLPSRSIFFEMHSYTNCMFLFW